MPQSLRPTKEAARHKSSGNHDTLIYRMAQILNKLNLGESLEPAALVEEFGVNIRTIQCDLNERLAYLPFNKIDVRDVERSVGPVGICELFPSLSDDVLRDIFDDRIQSPLLINSQRFEDLSGRKVPFQALEKARVTHRRIRIISPESVQYELESEVYTALARRPSYKRLGRVPTKAQAQSWRRA